ncbi:MAG: zinc-ribbon domain-containing protein [Thermodesulfobacteriota bacterium]
MALEEEKFITTSCKYRGLESAEPLHQVGSTGCADTWWRSEIKKMSPTPRICAVCGSPNAYIERVDHYLSLFSFPFLRIKKGAPFLLCEACDSVSDMFETKRSRSSVTGTRRVCCKHCQTELHGDVFCPSCGLPT